MANVQSPLRKLAIFGQIVLDGTIGRADIGLSAHWVETRAGQLDLDKAPYFVTLAVAIAGWSTSNLVNRVNSAPTLEYEVKAPTPNPIENHPAAKQQKVVLSNLTLATTFKDLSIEFQAPEGTHFVGYPEILSRQPAFEGNDPWKLEGGLIRYDIHRMHPGWQFVVNVTYEGEPPMLRLESEEPVFATRPTWETWVVRHETFMIGTIAITWVIVVAPFLLTNLWQWLRPLGQWLSPSKSRIQTERKTAEERERCVDDAG